MRDLRSISGWRRRTGLWLAGGVSLAALATAALSAEITITSAVTYDPGTMAGSDLVVDGAGARLTIGAGNTVTRMVDLHDGATVDNAGTIARSGEDNNGVVGGFGHVVNRDAGQITAEDENGILLYEGGSVENTGPGTLISGGLRGISLQHGPGTVTNTGGATITAGEIGVYLDTGGSITNGTGSSITAEGSGIRTFGETTVHNTGTITGTTGDGVSIESGTVTNSGADALIKAGDSGVFVDFGSAVTNELGARIEAALDGVVMNYGGDVTNSGGATIHAGSSGIVVWDYGTVTNSGAGSTISTEGGGSAIDFSWNLDDPFELINEDGAEVRGGAYGARFFDADATVTNRSGATISAQDHALYFETGRGTVLNTGAGSRLDTTGGNDLIRYTLFFGEGGDVTNTDGAIIAGGPAESSIGIYFYDADYAEGRLPMLSGSVTNGAGATISGATTAIHSLINTTVENAGRIEGNVWLLETAINHVTLHAGSIITGDLYIGGNSTSSLTLTGTGTQLFSDAVLGDTSFASKLIKTGAGTWIVDKALDATIINIDEGTLIVGVGGNGQVVGTVNVNPGSTLTGSGKVYGNVIVDNATVAPGNSPGVLEIIGGYAPGAGSVYEAELDPDNILSDRIEVAGNAVIATGALLEVQRTSQNPFVLGTRYTVLTTTTGRSGEFTLTGLTNPSAFLAIDDSYDTHNAYLTVIQSRALASAALTANQQATAAGLDGAAADNPARTAALNAADDTAARAAFDALSGEVHASLRTGLLLGGDTVRRAVLDQVRGPEATFWTRTLGSEGHLAGDGNARDVLNTTGGFLFGGDLPVADHLRLGLMAGVVGTGTGVGSATAAVTGYTLGLYGAAEFGGLAFRFGGTQSLNDIATRSATALPGLASASAHYAGTTTQLFAEAAWGVDFGPVTLEPFAGLSITSVSTGGFVETGTDLRSSGGTAHLALADLGLRASGVLDFGDTDLRVDASLGWRRVIAASAPTATMQFGAGSAFTVSGAPFPADALVVGLGLGFDLTESAALDLGYRGTFSVAGGDHALTGTLKVRF